MSNPRPIIIRNGNVSKLGNQDDLDVCPLCKGKGRYVSVQEDLSLVTVTCKNCTKGVVKV